MGFSEEAVEAVLAATNGSVEAALAMLLNQGDPEEIEVMAAEPNAQPARSPEAAHASDDTVLKSLASLAEMGFHELCCAKAILVANGDVDMASAIILSNSDRLPSDAFWLLTPEELAHHLRLSGAPALTIQLRHLCSRLDILQGGGYAHASVQTALLQFFRRCVGPMLSFCRHSAVDHTAISYRTQSGVRRNDTAALVVYLQAPRGNCARVGLPHLERIRRSACPLQEDDD